MHTLLVTLLHSVYAARPRRRRAKHVRHAAAAAACAVSVPVRAAAPAAWPGRAPVRVTVPVAVSAPTPVRLPVARVPRRAVRVVTSPVIAHCTFAALSRVGQGIDADILLTVSCFLSGEATVL